MSSREIDDPSSLGQLQLEKPISSDAAPPHPREERVVAVKNDVRKRKTEKKAKTPKEAKNNFTAQQKPCPQCLAMMPKSFDLCIVCGFHYPKENPSSLVKLPPIPGGSSSQKKTSSAKGRVRKGDASAREHAAGRPSIVRSQSVTRDLGGAATNQPEGSSRSEKLSSTQPVVGDAQPQDSRGRVHGKKRKHVDAIERLSLPADLVAKFKALEAKQEEFRQRSLGQLSSQFLRALSLESLHASAMEQALSAAGGVAVEPTTLPLGDAAAPQKMPKQTKPSSSSRGLQTAYLREVESIASLYQANRAALAQSFPQVTVVREVVDKPYQDVLLFRASRPGTADEQGDRGVAVPRLSPLRPHHSPQRSAAAPIDVDFGVGDDDDASRDAPPAQPAAPTSWLWTKELLATEDADPLASLAAGDDGDSDSDSDGSAAPTDYRRLKSRLFARSSRSRSLETAAPAVASGTFFWGATSQLAAGDTGDSADVAEALDWDVCARLLGAGDAAALTALLRTAPSPSARSPPGDADDLVEAADDASDRPSEVDDDAAPSDVATVAAASAADEHGADDADGADERLTIRTQSQRASAEAALWASHEAELRRLLRLDDDVEQRVFRQVERAFDMDALEEALESSLDALADHAPHAHQVHRRRRPRFLAERAAREVDGLVAASNAEAGAATTSLGGSVDEDDGRATKLPEDAEAAAQGERVDTVADEMDLLARHRLRALAAAEHSERLYAIRQVDAGLARQLAAAASPHATGVERGAVDDGGADDDDAAVAAEDLAGRSLQRVYGEIQGLHEHVRALQRSDFSVQLSSLHMQCVSELRRLCAALEQHPLHDVRDAATPAALAELAQLLDEAAAQLAFARDAVPQRVRDTVRMFHRASETQRQRLALRVASLLAQSTKPAAALTAAALGEEVRLTQTCEALYLQQMRLEEAAIGDVLAHWRPRLSDAVSCLHVAYVSAKSHHDVRAQWLRVGPPSAADGDSRDDVFHSRDVARRHLRSRQLSS